MSRDEWTPEEVKRCGDEAALAFECILEALTNTEYIDWLSGQEASSFTPATAKAVEMTLRDAHNERLLAAQVALRALDKLLIRTLDALDESDALDER